MKMANRGIRLGAIDQGTAAVNSGSLGTHEANRAVPQNRLGYLVISYEITVSKFSVPKVGKSRCESAIP
jgi:hypothetical protein